MRAKNRRGLISLLLSAIVLVAIFGGLMGCTKATETPVPETPAPETSTSDEVCVDVWNIPALVETRGIFGWYGREELWVFEQAEKDINAAGGVRGKPIEVTPYETGQEPSEKQVQMGKILETKPLVIASPGYVTTETMPMVVKEEVFVLCPSAVIKDDAEPFFPWCMTFSAPDEEDAGPAVRGWIEEQPEVTSALGLADPYRPGFINLIQNYLNTGEELGVEPLGLIEVPETTNYGPIATKALSYNADAFLLGTMEDATAKLIIEWDRRGFKDTEHILIFRFTDTAQLYEAGEGYLDGCYISGVSNPQSDNPAWIDLAARYAVDNPDPGIPSWNVPLKYDDILLIAQAIEETKATGCPDKLQEERLAIREYIRNVKDFEGIQFNRSFTDGIAEANVFLFQIENNEKVFIKRCE